MRSLASPGWKTNETTALGARGRRSADATRQAILEAARAAWTEHGFDEVGLREIAGRAGVTAAMVNRYFGTKARLFREAIGTDDPSPVRLATVDRAHFGRTIAPFLLAAKDAPGDVIATNDARSGSAHGLDPIRMLIRSASSPEAQPILREYVERTVMPPLVDYLSDRGDARERAAVILSVVLGTTVLGDILGVEPLARPTGEDSETLLELLESTLQAVVDAPTP